MSDAKLRRLAAWDDLIDSIRHSRKVIRIWETVRELISNPEIAVSGRLTLKQQNGQRVVEWKGVAPIRKQFQVPTLLIDATLPAKRLLQVYHPQVEIVADIKVRTPPSVRVKQVLGSPTSANKLDSKEHLREIQLYIFKRWMETGRQSTLVICQQKVEDWLREHGVPKDTKIAHYNDIAGLDDFKDVRLLLLIGRTAPGPRAMESLAGALTGALPTIVPDEPKGFTWYPPVKRGIALRDGFGIATTGDQHPDAMVEAIRWQVHEAQLMQAIGRGRAVNRTAATPLDIDLLFDTCLPIAVDQVVRWRDPSRLLVTAVTGVMLTSPHDLVTVWPRLWPNTKAADRTLKQGVPELPGFEPFEYQLAGSGMNRRAALFDRALIPDPRAWLAERLGPLTPL
jgi:putative DNA primase/helicase